MKIVDARLIAKVVLGIAMSVPVVLGFGFLITGAVISKLYGDINTSRESAHEYADAYIRVKACATIVDDVDTPSSRLLYRLVWEEDGSKVIASKVKVEELVTEYTEQLLRMSLVFDVDKVCKMWENKLSNIVLENI